MKKNCNEPIKRMKWMTKRIKKDSNAHIIAFCPKCTSGDPWIIHGETKYTMIQINMENQNEIAMQQKKVKTNEGWLSHPEKVPYYRERWCLAERHDKPIDWREQENKYNRKIVTYKQKKQEYDDFCTQKLSLTTCIEDHTSEEKEESEELKKSKANEERFLEFTSKCHTNPPTHMLTTSRDRKPKSRKPQ
jgi:hypothetical protein